MTTLHQASHQWASRPDDERFVSLLDMAAHFEDQVNNSRQLALSSRKIIAEPEQDRHSLVLRGPAGNTVAPTHWAFGQLAAIAEAPAGYLRTIPSAIAADCINYGLQYKRSAEDLGILLHRNGEVTCRAVTGPKFGRIWNRDIVNGLVDRFGDGTSGQWTVPGEFRKAITVDKSNTTLFAGDRDMFVFLADEKNRIEIPNRRNGEPGSLARGFFVWNSEVGAATLGVATFLFDYVCCNRIVWGAKQYSEIRIRHTPKAPDRWVEEVAPALLSYSQASSLPIMEAIKRAQAARLDDVDEFLSKRFGNRIVAKLHDVAMEEENRPIETIWDASCAVTAYARSMGHQDTRVEWERKGGDLLNLA